MAKASISDLIYHDEDAARAHFEALRWPDGRTCPHCGVVGDDQSTLLQGKSHRPGLYKCKPCGKPFTATIGTVYEDSKVPLHQWLLATHLMCSSKKGISALQLQRELALGSYRTAWFMAHRIREAMTDTSDTPLGGEGKVVEADETYYGKPAITPTKTTRGGPLLRGAKRRNSRPVVALVERGGRAKVFHVAVADKATVSALVMANVDPASRLHTDESRLYKGAADVFAAHETVRHSAGEYARGDVNTNSAEGFFGVFKKGMKGVYQHCSEKHLNRYVTEFGFRHNTREKLGFSDAMRTDAAITGTIGKRLTYRRTDEAYV
ncbi:MAG: IS1595 family transposase [Alphaproteobacteria bacterium]|nr:IS1595 family transposase [Alphaproteobacteria bacterium]MBU1525562.1 IS1595 family transposase [Alphaproteobacteria bacterium]MBU2116966.1 IS1595 family transposase [Alphaproteobacteria bacterium]MBU2350497.1 IS1595 family transposase [Alphaproteobacteria bacterium]MBU2381510.1 IS1595 family transposase [Alphaproteobacteria bacterium]